MQNHTTNSLVQIGTRVTTNLYNRGTGTIYAIHGQQLPNTVRMFGGVMHSGGNAEFDIVFDCGSISSKLPECILYGIQWIILDQQVSADFIAAALAKAACVAAARTAKEAEAKNAFNRALENLKTAPEYAHLTQHDGKIYCSKLAVMNIRADLKKVFKGIKFSVRSDHNSVRISWTDGVVKKQVEEIVNRYKDGHFNGMEDMYEYSKSPWTEVFGGISYPSIHRETSAALIQRAINALFAESPSNFADVQKPTPEEFKAGKTWCIDVPGYSETLQTLIHQKLNITV